MKSRLLTLTLLPFFLFSQTEEPGLQLVKTNNTSNFRAISFANDQVIFMGGDGGTIGRSDDGGFNWEFTQHGEAEITDYRSIYALDENRVIIANAGSPAYVQLSEDGGQNWVTAYENHSDGVFIDGVDFWDENEGLIFGDPMDGKLFLLKTTDGGRTWTEITSENLPDMVEGEAAFAASGTTIRCFGDQKAVIATGGKKARLLLTEDGGLTWKVIKTPMLQGQESTGIFSVAVTDEEQFIIVGGDYKQPELVESNAFFTNAEGEWRPSHPTVSGYRECVEFIDGEVVIALGPTGMEISMNNGQSWKHFSDEKGFHVIRKSRNGATAIAAGSEGKIAVLRPLED